MQGLMQDWPLLCHRVLDHAKALHGGREIVTRSIEGPIHRTNYREIHGRALKVAQALNRMGLKEGERVATLAWNTWRHIEVFYGIMGNGSVYHTINPRLFPDQIAYIVNHAEDKAIFVDLTFVPLLEALQDKLPTIAHYIILTDRDHMPETSLPDAICYEDWLAEADGDFAWVQVDETAAAGMCYTSGTTGNPKGVVYSHRSNVFHALVAVQPEIIDLSSKSTVLPVVPIFHANAWVLPFSAPMVGASLVLPGMKLDGESIFELLDTYKVTSTAAVPTVWLMLLQYLEETGKELPYLNKVTIGGSACPRAMTQKFQDRYGVEVIHGWGMTEMSPLGSICTLKREYAHLTGEEKLGIQETVGHPPFSVELKLTDDGNNELAWDGETSGHLKVRGLAISSGYFKGEGGNVLDEYGFFDTGDVASINEHGYVRITDRSKDVIKSGGEWISSIDVENVAMGHPDVAEAAVIGKHHPKWDERPLLIVVKKQGRDPKPADILAFLEGKIAKWWMPDDVQFVDELPHTATGKVHKLTLRERFKDYTLPTARIAS